MVKNDKKGTVDYYKDPQQARGARERWFSVADDDDCINDTPLDPDAFAQGDKYHDGRGVGDRDKLRANRLNSQRRRASSNKINYTDWSK